MAARVKTLGPVTDVRLVETLSPCFAVTDVRLVETLSPCFVMVHTSALRSATRDDRGVSVLSPRGGADVRRERGKSASVGEEAAGFARRHQIPS